MSSPDQANTEPPTGRTEHPIAAAIDSFVHRARDIKGAARHFLPVARRLHIDGLEARIADLKRSTSHLKSSDSQTRVLGIKEMYDAAIRINRQLRSHVPEVLEAGLFMALFSGFDAFTGDLLRALYQRRPELFQFLERSLTFGEVLSAESIDSLKAHVLDDDIENLRRKSYAEQFATLSKRFDLKLTEFERWPDFIEASQRRNLLTHCDGVVSRQYLNVCHGAGFEGRLPLLGEKIQLGTEYLQKASELLIEVAIKLGQTLWRKALPNELQDADEHISGLLFDSLRNKVWHRSRMIGKFVLEQRRLSSDVVRRMSIINYAQALKRGGAESEATKLLDGVDWSATAADFRLAHSVLTDDFDRAARLMVAIGPKGDWIREESYHLWPLFLEFRETDLFGKAYEKVFGYPFAIKALEDAIVASETAAEELKIDRQLEDSQPRLSSSEIDDSKEEQAENGFGSDKAAETSSHLD